MGVVVFFVNLGMAITLYFLCRRGGRASAWRDTLRDRVEAGRAKRDSSQCNEQLSHMGECAGRVLGAGWLLLGQAGANCRRLLLLSST